MSRGPSTIAGGALAGSGAGELQRTKSELRREVERREQAEAALLHVEQRATAGEVTAGEVVALRRRVEQLTAELRRAREELAAAAPKLDLDEVSEAAAVFNDALAELKSSLRLAVDEAELLSAPSASVRVVREALRSGLDQLEGGRERLRAMIRKLGLRNP